MFLYGFVQNFKKLMILPLEIVSFHYQAVQGNYEAWYDFCVLSALDGLGQLPYGVLILNNITLKSVTV